MTKWQFRLAIFRIFKHRFPYIPSPPQHSVRRKSRSLGISAQRKMAHAVAFDLSRVDFYRTPCMQIIFFPTLDKFPTQLPQIYIPPFSNQWQKWSDILQYYSFVCSIMYAETIFSIIPSYLLLVVGFLCLFGRVAQANILKNS